MMILPKIDYLLAGIPAPPSSVWVKSLNSNMSICFHNCYIHLFPHSQYTQRRSRYTVVTYEHLTLVCQLHIIFTGLLKHCINKEIILLQTIQTSRTWILKARARSYDVWCKMRKIVGGCDMSCASSHDPIRDISLLALNRSHLFGFLLP